MTKRTKRNAYEIITDRIIELLSEGTVPWRKPWAGAGVPTNLKSGRAYRGINVFLLACTGYESEHWLTYKQAKAMGGHVRKGERGYPIVFWNWVNSKTDDDSADETATFRRPILRYYTVFNVSQCEGIEAPARVVGEREIAPLAACDALLAAMPNPPTIRHGEARAYYRPSADLVNMPRRATFESAETYYATLFHELSHSTGHESRLARKGITELDKFGSHSYSKEELVAEMGASFLCGHSGISPATLEQSAAYIKSWLKVLKGDARLVVTAAAQAQKAVDCIRGTEWTETETAKEAA